MPAPHAFIQAGVVHRRSGLLPSMEVAGGNLRSLGFDSPRFHWSIFASSKIPFVDSIFSLIVHFVGRWLITWGRDESNILTAASCTKAQDGLHTSLIGGLDDGVSLLWKHQAVYRSSPSLLLVTTRVGDCTANSKVSQVRCDTITGSVLARHGKAHKSP